MKLINPMEMIYKARANGCAIASFNVHNLETIQAVAEVATEERCPVIIQTTPGTMKHVGIPYIVSMVQTAANVYDVPIALHADHCLDYETIMQCIHYGYTSVMIDASHLSYHENVALVKKVVDAAHSAGVAVEGEIGRIGGVEEDITATAAFTVPDEARIFVEQTGVDMLAIAIGTAHGAYKGEPTLDFIRLSEIRKLVDVPLVLHGASGVPDHQIREALERGVAKINIATEIKMSMTNAIREILTNLPVQNDPRQYMGKAKEAVKAVVREKIRLCNSTRSGGYMVGV